MVVWLKVSESGRPDSNRRPPEPHSDQGEGEQRQNVGFSRDSGRRCRTFTTSMSHFAGRNAPQNAPPSLVVWRRGVRRTGGKEIPEEATGCALCGCDTGFAVNPYSPTGSVHSGDALRRLKTRAWRAGWGTTNLETRFTLFTYDCTILPPIGTSSFHFPYL